MTGKRRGLGRGLSDLGLSELLSHHQNRSQNPSSDGVPHLYLDQIHPNRLQPRKNFDPQSLEELAASIRQQGILQPLVVRPDHEGYELVAGERRWRAAQLAQLESVPALIKDINDEQAAAFMLIENLQREDLSPLEQAHALERLQKDFAMSHQAIAEAVGKSRVSVTNTLRLLQLNESVQALLASGELEIGHGKALLGLKDEAQTQAAQYIVRKNLSVRAAEKLVQDWGQLQAPQPQTPIDPNVRYLQRDLEQKLGAHVKIQHTSKGKGKLIIHYNDLDELDGILNHIQ